MFENFVVFEGIDRSGKSTVVSKLKEKIEKEKKFRKEVFVIQFPKRESLTGELLSKYLSNEVELVPQAVHLLFSSNRWENASLIEENRRSKLVICDRYFYSGIAYSHAKGIDFDWCKKPDEGLPCPDLIFFFDVKPETVSKRTDFSKERYEKIEFLEKVYGTYKKIFLNNPNCVFIDEKMAQDEIVDFVMEKIMQKINS